MKLLNIKRVAIFSLALLSFASCSHFEDMNKDPNQATEVPTSALLTQAQFNLVSNLDGEVGQLGAQYAQFYSQTDYTDKSNYSDDGVSSFNSIYRGGLRDLKEIIILNQNNADDYLEFGDNNHQIAVAKILMAWAFHSVSDVWGDIPYSQAVNDDYITPKYDTQEAIYEGLIKDLNDAQDLINAPTSSVSLKGDLIFDGDMTKWDQFAESLKVRIAMRLTEIDEDKAKSIISSIDFTKATSNQAVEFGHLDTDSEANPIYRDNIVNAGGDYFVPSNTVIDFLINTSDPRLETYAEPAATSGTYVGLTYGLVESSNKDDFSPLSEKYAGKTAPSIIMTSSEILFAKAEAIERNYIAGNADVEFNAAIRASMEYNNVDSDKIDAYMATITYDAANWREEIATQKWIALFGQGIQAWAEWRRLDFPVLTPGPGASISTIPRRRAYNTNEYSTNLENVTEAVKRLESGNDLYTERIWWDAL
ncbi:MAG: SusD/RagB family nutrient-binding outer membrane lipoprotein [Bacteroidota bacterium]